VLVHQAACKADVLCTLTEAHHRSGCENRIVVMTTRVERPATLGTGVTAARAALNRSDRVRILGPQPCLSCVDGLRAALKTLRSRFDPEGRHERRIAGSNPVRRPQEVGSVAVTRSCLLSAFVAQQKSKRLLPARLLVQVQPRALRVHRSMETNRLLPGKRGFDSFWTHAWVVKALLCRRHLARHFESACAEDPQPGNNWIPGRATSECSLVVRRVVWNHQAAGSTPVTPTNSRSPRRPDERGRARETMKR
jgi:hypothetical protein